MADRGKRRECPGLSSLHSQRRRLRHYDQTDESRSPAGTLIAAIKAVLVVVGVLGAVGAATAEAHTPVPREPAYNPSRLAWQQHVEDLDKRGPNCFKRYYRMDKVRFIKLANRLRPSIEANAHYGALRSANGAIPVEIRLAVALRMLAGANYMDVGLLFGIAFPTVYFIMWEVVDAINRTTSVGPFRFPTTEEECAQEAAKWQAGSTNGVFSNVVAAVDGLLVKTKAPSASDTANVMQYFSGSKSSYGINVQATCSADYRFCQVSAKTPGATNDWAAWNRSSLATAVAGLPGNYAILGDAAYPLSNKLLTPYPGKSLSQGKDSFNFHLSQLRVRIEQTFGIFVSTWGILWKPLKVQFAGRTSLILPLCRLHNFLQDEKVSLLTEGDEDSESGAGRPILSSTGTLPADWRTAPAPSRSGECPARAEIRFVLERDKKWRPSYNVVRNS